MKDYLFCLVGPSGSGKTTIAYELQEKHGYNVIESYTTRPPRYEGEKGHVFVDDGIEDAWNWFPWLGGKALPGNVIAYNNYNGYEYWATREQYQDKGVSLYVVDVPGAEMLKKTVKDAEIVVIALWADDETLWWRLAEREGYYKQRDFDGLDKVTGKINTRFKNDIETFAVIPCDYAVNANKDIDTVTKRLRSIIQKCLQTRTPMV